MRLPLRPGAGTFVLVTLGQLGFTWLSVVLLRQANGVTPMWSPLSTAVVSLALFWPDRRIPRSGAFLGVALAQFGSVVVALVAAGVRPVAAAWVSAVNLAAAVGLGWLWRRYNVADDWAPGNSTSVVLLTTLCWALAPLVVLLGGTVGLPRTPVGTWQHILWAMRIGDSTLVGLPVSLLLFVSAQRSVIRHRLSPNDAGWAVTSVACLLVPFLTNEYPVAWLFFVPALWAALTFTPRTVAVLGLAAAALTVSGTRWGPWTSTDGAPIPTNAILETALATAVALAWFLVYQREDMIRQRRNLMAARQRALTQNTVLEGVLLAMHDGLLLLDETGRIRLANPAVRRLLGQNLAAAANPESWWHSYGLVDAETGEPITADKLTAFFRPGPRRSAEMTVRAQRTAGSPSRVFRLRNEAVVYQNSTQRLILIRDHTAASEHRQQLKAFAGAVAHDLKNPLAGLALWMDSAAEALRRGDADEGGDDLRHAVRLALGMGALIDDCLAYAVTCHGTLQPSTITPGDLVAMLQAYPDRRLRLHAELDHAILADAALVSQVTRNLVDNAVKYARPGQPAELAVTSTLLAQGWVKLAFADRGTGLEPGEEQHVFTKSRRGAGRVDDHSGVGLGLALCKAVVERHGGRIEAARNECGGTTISFTLPGAALSDDAPVVLSQPQPQLAPL